MFYLLIKYLSIYKIGKNIYFVAYYNKNNMESIMTFMLNLDFASIRYKLNQSDFYYTYSCSHWTHLASAYDVPDNITDVGLRQKSTWNSNFYKFQIVARKTENNEKIVLNSRYGVICNLIEFS